VELSETKLKVETLRAMNFFECLSKSAFGVLMSLLALLLLLLAVAVELCVEREKSEKHEVQFRASTPFTCCGAQTTQTNTHTHTHSAAKQSKA